MAYAVRCQRSFPTGPEWVWGRAPVLVHPRVVPGRERGRAEEAVREPRAGRESEFRNQKNNFQVLVPHTCFNCLSLPPTSPAATPWKGPRAALGPPGRSRPARRPGLPMRWRCGRCTWGTGPRIGVRPQAARGRRLPELWSKVSYITS